MSYDTRTWLVHEETVGQMSKEGPMRVLVVSRGWDGVADSEGPTFYSLNDVERFIDELRAAACRTAFGSVAPEVPPAMSDEQQHCQCQGDHDLFIWRGDPDWVVVRWLRRSRTSTYRSREAEANQGETRT